MTPTGSGENDGASGPSADRGPQAPRVEESVGTDPAPHAEDRSPGNLPLELTSFIGREKELAEVGGLLAGQRLLTLTGPGGSGKTRLALAVALEVVEGFEDGAWWVGLASLSDLDLVPQAVAQALGVREHANRQLADTLADTLRGKELLLLLDNCEHLIDVCAALADKLLHSCPNLHILATSREALGVAGETVWPVPPLSVPEPEDLPRVEELARYEAVKLFVERARSAVPSFELGEENAGAVGRVCARLEGIPLAIELAAARLRVLSVEQVAVRLEESFRLLRSESWTADPRHRTLAATIEWSYGLLSERERALFRRLTVFAGGWTLEAAEEVCAGEGVEKDEVLDLLTHLVDKSLVLVAERQQGGEARYRMLETVRQYGQELLEGSGESDSVRYRHAEFFLALAEEAAPELFGPNQAAEAERLETEHGNLRAAMRWLLERGDTETAVRLAWALWFFWYLHGHQGEGYRYTSVAMEKGGVLPTGMRAKVLCVRGVMSYGLDSLEDTMRLFEESAALFRQTGDRSGLAIALGGMGLLALQQGDMERATAIFEEGAELFRELGDRWGLSTTLGHLGLIPLNQGDYARAAGYFEEALALSRETENRHAGYISLHNLALMARAQGDHERAAGMYAEALRLAVEVRDKANAAYCLEGLAGVAQARGAPERATRLFGASEALLEAVGAPLYAQAQDRALYERAVEELRSWLGEESFASAWEGGRAMMLEEAIEYALSEASPPSTLPQEQGDRAGLSERELEVLRLVAAGLTDPQVAQRLYISPRTVGWHLRSIYRKLGVPTRAAAAKEAAQRSLI